MNRRLPSFLNSVGRIGDFSQAEGDQIDLSEIDANLIDVGDQAFVFIGTGDFDATAGQIRFFQEDGNTIVQVDLRMSTPAFPSGADRRGAAGAFVT